MDFSWSEEQQDMRRRVADLGRSELNHDLRARDARGEFNREGWLRCAQFGVLGMLVPPEYGGLGLDAVSAVGVLERLGYGCKDNGLVFAINAHMWAAQMPLLHFGSEEQKQQWLPGLASGRLIGGNAMTEAESGSDAFGLATTARRRDDRYILNGTKMFVSNGSVADVLVVYATVDRARGPRGISTFLVENGAPGLKVSAEVEKMGLRTAPMAELFFEDCEVPAENRLGEEGNGADVFAHSMSWERACILAGAVGAMDRLLETAVRHAKTRKQFGQAIGKFQLVASRIVDMKIRVETARASLYRTAWLRDQGKSIFLDAALTKLHISESWVRSAEDALQIHGGYGYMKECELERELRDALGSRIYSGTSEIQRVLIGSLLGL